MIKIELNQVNLEAWQIGQNDLIMHKEKLYQKKIEFENQNKKLIDNIARLSDDLDLEKSEFKQQAVKLFEKNGEKKLLGGLGIRQSVELMYDGIKAYKWAVEHNLCLQLDKRAFENLAKTQNVEFVTKLPKIAVTFPKEIKFEGVDEN